MRGVINADRFRGRGLVSIIMLICVVVAVGASVSRAQAPAPPADWKAWSFLIGEWEGEGGTTAGQATGGFKFYLDLSDRILVRTNYADYPATADKPAYSHSDLMVTYQEPGASTHATYWDNEGHVINYAASVSSDTTAWTFVSDTSSTSPRFRLTYTKTGEKTVAIKFEFAPPGQPDAFSTYIEASAHKK